MLAERTPPAPARGESETQLRNWCRASAADAVGRVLAVVAHPDDEVLGLGARMWSVAPQLDVAYVSDGAPAAEQFYCPQGFCERAEYARARRQEAQRALALAGLGPGQVHELGLIDQQVAPAIESVSEWILQLLAALAGE